MPISSICNWIWLSQQIVKECSVEALVLALVRTFRILYMAYPEFFASMVHWINCLISFFSRDMWVELEDIATGRALVSLSWLEASADRDHLEEALASPSSGGKAGKEEENLAKCLLHVYVDSCREERRRKKRSGSS